MSRSNGGSGGSQGGGNQSVSTLAQPPDNQAAGQLESAAGEVDGFVSQVSGALQDPLSMLVGSGVEFVIDWVQPVQDAIQLVTGDGPALEESAGKFSDLQTACDELAKELANTFDSQLGNWQGDAGDAARKKLAEFVEGVQNTGMQAHNLSELLKMSAVMMEAAEEVIKGILTDFLTWAIVTWIAALAAAAPTFGGSTAAATAATGVEAGITCTRAATQVQRILKIIETIGTVIDAITAIIDAARIVESVNTITSGTGNEGSGDELSAAKETAEKAGEVSSQTEEDVTSVADAAGIDTEAGNDAAGTDGQNGSTSSGDGSTADGSSGDGTAGDGSSNGDGSAAQDGGQEPFDMKGSVTEHGSEQLGESADKLQEQAKEGGFSQVPADATISGQLDI